MTNHSWVERPSGAWVAERLAMIHAGATRESAQACVELVTWIYEVARCCTRSHGLHGTEADDAVQDSMVRIAQALAPDEARLARASNPAALLVHTVARAVDEAYYVQRMCGFGGVAPNGQHAGTPYPERAGGGALVGALEGAVDDETSLRTDVDRVVGQVAQWVRRQVGIRLGQAALDGAVYVVDRLVAGISRTTLVTGGHSRLGVDPAMRHLGFTSAGAGAFGIWLLGRRDGSHNTVGLLDAALGGVLADAALVERWRAEALKHGFGALTNRAGELLSA